MIEENQEMAEPLMQKPAYPTVKQSWGIVGMFIVITIVYGIPLGIISMFFPEINHGPFLLANYGIPLLLTIWLIKSWRIKNPMNQEEIKIEGFPLAILPLIVLVCAAVLIINLEMSSWLPMPDWVSKLFEQMMEKNLWGFLTVVVLAPILEEYLLRGIVLDGMLKNLSPRKAILWSAFFFGFIHLNPWQFMVGFIMGIVLGYLYYKTKSLLLCMMVHAINNGVAFLLMLKYPEMDSLAELLHLGILQRLGVFAMAIVILYAAYLQLQKFFAKRDMAQ